MDKRYYSNESTGHIGSWTHVHSWTRVQIWPCPVKKLTRQSPVLFYIDYWVMTNDHLNRCADFLAHAGCSLDEDFVIFDLPSSDVLLNMLSSNSTGLYSLRLTATTSPFMTSLFNIYIFLLTKKKKNLSFRVHYIAKTNYRDQL